MDTGSITETTFLALHKKRGVRKIGYLEKTKDTKVNHNPDVEIVAYNPQIINNFCHSCSPH